MLNFLYTLIVFPVEQVIELCYVFAWRISGSHGLSVLGVSLAVSTLVLPIYLMAEKQQQAEREKQAAMKDEVNVIKAVFKGDKRYMLLSTLYRQNGYHPVYSLRGSLDLFIQIPFFIAAYHFLHGLVPLRGQAFFFIKDLGEPDGLFYGMNLLPFVMTAVNIVSSAIYARGFSLRENIQLYGMALVFLILLYSSPSALVLYWTSNNVYNLVKNILRKTKQTGKIVAALVSVFFAVLTIFMLFVHSGSRGKRLLVAGFALVLSFTPLWIKLFRQLVRRFGKMAALSQNGVRASALNPGVIYAGSCLVLLLLTGLVIPSALISSSVEEFSLVDGFVNPLSFLGNTFLQSAGIFVFWAFFLYVLSGKKTKLFLAAASSSLMVLALLNTFVFRGGYGAITNALELSKTDGLTGLFAASTAINAAVLAAAALLPLLPKKTVVYSLQAVTVVSCLVFGALTAVKINEAYGRLDKTLGKKPEIVSPGAEYTFSRSGKNVLVIILDRAFSGYVPHIFAEKPELEEAFRGFIFFPNTVSFGGHTLMGIAPVYGGYEYTPLEMNRRDDVPLVDKHNEALLVLPRLFSSSGFAVSVTDPAWANYSWTSDVSIFKNYPGIHAERVMYSEKYLAWWKSSVSFERNISSIKHILRNDLIRFSFFRAAPPVLRNIVYDHGKYLRMYNENKIHPDTLDAYAALDILGRVTEITDRNVNTYNCIYNDLPHQPAFFQYPDYDITEEVSAAGKGELSGERSYHVNMASFLLLAKYFRYLGENGVYDNTRIIIASDHGLTNDKDRSKVYSSALPGKGGPLFQYTPLLMVKDFGASGPLRTDDSFMTNADVPVLAVNGLIPNPVNPFTGAPLEADKKNGITMSVSHKWSPDEHGKFRFDIEEGEWLHVRDTIFRADNWTSAEEMKR